MIYIMGGRLGLDALLDNHRHPVACIGIYEHPSHPRPRWRSYRISPRRNGYRS